MQALYNLTMPTAEVLTLFATITAYFALTDTVRTRSITYSAYRYYDCLHNDYYNVISLSIPRGLLTPNLLLSYLYTVLSF